VQVFLAEALKQCVSILARLLFEIPRSLFKRDEKNLHIGLVKYMNIALFLGSLTSLVVSIGNGLLLVTDIALSHIGYSRELKGVPVRSLKLRRHSEQQNIR
jgi:hypothetical protein